MERISYQDMPEGMYEQLLSVENYLNNSPIEKPLIGLLKLRVSQLNGCAYCVDMHHKELKYANETDLRLYSLCVWKEAPYFTEKERVVLSFTEALTQINSEPIPNEIYDPMLLFFNKKEICLITLAIAQINTWNRLMKTFNTIPGNYEVKK